MNPQHYATYNAPLPPPLQQQTNARTGSSAFGSQFASVGRTGSMAGGAMPVVLSAWTPPSPQEHQYYDMLFTAADEEKRNAIGGRIAVAFFSRSGVDKLHLREIWTIADSQQRSELSRNEFYVAMRLISMAQRGEQVSTQRFHELATMPFPLPAIGGVAPPMAPMAPHSSMPPVAAHTGTSMRQRVGGYAMTEEEMQRYDGIFRQHDTDNDGFLNGGEAVQLFGMSGLDRGVLRDIWALADRGQDSRLDSREFYVAMHLIVCVSKRGMPLPTELPSDLVESVFGNHRSVGPASTNLVGGVVGAPSISMNTATTIQPPTPAASASASQDMKSDPMDAFASISIGMETVQPSRVASFGLTHASLSSQPEPTMAAGPRLSGTPISLSSGSDSALASLNFVTPPQSTTGSFEGSNFGMASAQRQMSARLNTSGSSEPGRERAGSASSISSFTSVSTETSAYSQAIAHAPASNLAGFAPMGSFQGHAVPLNHAPMGAPPVVKPFLSDDAESAAVRLLDQANENLAQALQGVGKKQHAIELLSEKLRELDQLRHELVLLSINRDSLRAASSANTGSPQPQDDAADSLVVRAVEQMLRDLVEGEKATIHQLHADISRYEAELQASESSVPTAPSDFSVHPAAGGSVASSMIPSPLATSVLSESTPKNAFEAFDGFGSSSPAPDSKDASLVEDAFANFNFT